MNRFFILCFIAISTIACKNQENPSETVEVKSTTTVVNDENTFRGEFIFREDAAVLTTNSEIYAVRIDEKMHELNELAVPLKKTDFDMVNVVIVGDTIANPMKAERGYGWDQMIIIKEIKSVTPATSAAVVAPVN